MPIPFSPNFPRLSPSILRLINALCFVPNNNKCQHKSIVLFKELPPKKDPIIDFDAAVALLRGTSEAVIQESVIQQTNIRFELRRPRRTLQPKNFRKVSKLRDPLTPLQVFFAQLHSCTGLQAS